MSFEFSKSPTLEKLGADHKHFNYEKMKWNKWQTPRNLLLALIGELGELATDGLAYKEFKATNDAESESDERKASVEQEAEMSVEQVLAELSDVFSYLICLSNECWVDLADLASNRKEYPDLSKCFKFSSTDWNEIEVSAFYKVDIPTDTDLPTDILKLCFCVSSLSDIWQWKDIGKKLDNLNDAKRNKADGIIKNVFCNIVALASKYSFDLPKLLREKNVSVAEKYADCIGKLSKDDVINKRYGDLIPFFQTDISQNNIKYSLDTPVSSENNSVSLLSSLIESIGLISEVFQWDTDGEIETIFTAAKNAHISHQIAKIVHHLMVISQKNDVTLSKAFSSKMMKNSVKYPVDICKGLSKKYDELAISANKDESAENLSVGIIETIDTVDDAAEAMRVFASERDWGQFHTPRNLTFALFGEIGELIEVFNKPVSQNFHSSLSDELADCLAFSVRLAQVCGIDLSAALQHYFSSSCTGN